MGALWACAGRDARAPGAAPSTMMLATQGDPIAYTPPPEAPSSGGSGRPPAGQRPTGPTWAAPTSRLAIADAPYVRQLVQRLIVALSEQDEPALTALLAPRVVRVSTGQYTLRERLVRACLEELQRNPDQSQRDLVDLIDSSGITMTPAELDAPRRGLRRTAYDYALQVPIPAGLPARYVPPCLPTLYVRLGPAPAVVGVE